MRSRTLLLTLACFTSSMTIAMDGRCGGEPQSTVHPRNAEETTVQLAQPVEERTTPTSIGLVRVFENVSLQTPVWLEEAPNGADTWYAVQQTGTIGRIAGGELEIALDLSDRVKSGGERGLLGLALHPKFETNGQIFVNYTSTTGGSLETRISRFISKDGGKSFDAGSEKILLSFKQPFSNHNGGQVSFGPDGFLYIGVGDGGSAGDPNDDGQNPKTLLGSILRIDVDSGDDKRAYGIPTDNPFVAHPDQGRPEIFAWGLRNPWRFSWDTETGKLWAGDVGQNKWEEINIIERGANYGWRQREAGHCYEPAENCETKGMTEPVVEYDHAVGQSVTGGYVYRGKALPALEGNYLYADFVSGRIWAYDLENKKTRELLDTSHNISTFAQGRDGELYVVNYGAGAVYKFVATPRTP